MQRMHNWSNQMKKKETKAEAAEKAEILKDVTLADVYEGLVCLDLKLSQMLTVFEKIDKLIDKREGK